MAYQYDEMGNVVGEYESDEERRRRLEAEAAQQPVKQTVTYKPDGTQEMTIRGTPQALSSANPNTPTLVQPGPVAPDTTFQRMQQVESGGRDFNAQGQPLTSSAGAMYRNQVMPATAANPGYGIRPAANQSPEEYNRVGQEYYQAMLKQFGGDQQKAAAAYNAGPGRVQQNIQANAGQMNVAQLPRETQGYLQKIGQAVGNMIPSAQAGTLPTPIAPGQNARDDLMMRSAMPVAPTAPQPDSVINNQVAQYEQQRQQQALNLPPDPFQTYINLQDNPKDLINFGYDNSMPDNLKQRARERASELLAQERGMKTAREQIPTMSETDIARALREKTTGGSYIKAALFALLGMENSAMNEAAKLGIGREQALTLDGQPVIVKVATNGTPIEGYNAATGRALTANELVSALGGGAGKNKPDVSTQDVQATINGQTVKGRVVTTYNAQNQPTTRVESGGKFYPYTGDWTPVSVTTAAMKMDYGLINDLKKKHGGNVLDALKQFEENKGPLEPQQRQEFLQLYGMGSTIPAGARPEATAGTTTTPGAQTGATGGAPATNLREPVGDMKTSQVGQREIVKKAADVIAESDKLVTNLLTTERAAQDALTKKNNFGTIIHGTIPGEQTVGRVLKTQDYVNTQNVLDVVNKQAATNAKMLGVNPTDRDLQFVTSTKPDETWSADAVADWLRKSADGTRRTLDFARRQIETGGRYIPETPQSGAAPGTAANPIKL